MPGLDFASLMSTPVPSSQPASEPAETEAPEATEPAEGDPTIAEGQESALGGDDEVQEEAEPSEPGTLEDDREYELDGKKLKGAELKKSLLRQEDYTRKTQALAAERKQIEAEKAEAIEARDEMLEWVSEFKDPGRAVFQLRRNFPETYDAIREFIIEQALEEQDLDPTTLKYKRAAEQAEIERLGREEDEGYQRKKAEKTEKFKKTAELAQTFNGWIAGAMTTHGLDPASDKQQKLLRGYIRSEYTKVSWTEAHFNEAAKAVAEALGIKPKADPKVEAAKKLPTVKPTGQRAPVNAPKKNKAPERKPSENHFEELRRKYGLA